MLSIDFLLDLAVILISTKFLGLITKKIQMPQVVGALFAGLILGPACLGVIHETDFIAKMSELGVIVLMFGAGLETDIKELKKCGKASFFIALIGVIVPLLGGFIVSVFFNNSGNVLKLSSKSFIENMFIGVVLTATSVSITVETLQEMGKLKTASGTAILGAAVIDDILGIILLTIITGMSDASVNIFKVLLKIGCFFLFAVIIGYIFYKIFNKYGERHGEKRRIALVAFVFCLGMSYISEKYFGVADITGAYIAGIVISNTTRSHYIAHKIEIISYMLLAPIFFANVGIKTVFTGLSGSMMIFSVSLLIVAIITKITGCGIGAKLCGYTNDESIKIGVGMISRGEVALIVADIGVSMNLLSSEYFGPVILVVIVTTLITPILLKIVYTKSENNIIKAGLQKYFN